MNSERFIKENQISEIIKKDNNCSAHFQWSQSYNNLILDVITFNPEHNNYFLLHTVSKPNTDINPYEKILDEMIEYIKEQKQSYLNYSVEWNYKNSTETAKRSYFSGKNIQEILQKFYYQKDSSNIVIYNIIMISES